MNTFEIKNIKLQYKNLVFVIITLYDADDENY